MIAAYTEKLLCCKLSTELKSHPEAPLEEKPEEMEELSMLPKYLKKFEINCF